MWDLIRAKEAGQDGSKCQAQLVEERGSTDYLSVESEAEQRLRLDGSSSRDGERWWERREATENELSFPHVERPEDNFPVSWKACEVREIHGVQDPHIERSESELSASSCLSCAKELAGVR